MNPPVLLDMREAIATITLNRPDAGNRIDGALAQALRDACARVALDDAIRCVLVRAAGDDFCAGGVPADSATLPEERMVASAVASLPQPVVAALHGSVAGHGLELALAADIRIAGDDLRASMPQVVEGEFPFDGGTQRLPRAVGASLATEMLLAGRVLDAPAALACGLVSQVLPVSGLQSRAVSLATAIARRGSLAARYVKEAVRRGIDLPMDEGLLLEADLSILLHTSPERAAGLAAWRRRHATRTPASQRSD